MYTKNPVVAVSGEERASLASEHYKYRYIRKVAKSSYRGRLIVRCNTADFFLRDISRFQGPR
jgi:hypothetical protein